MCQSPEPGLLIAVRAPNLPKTGDTSSGLDLGSHLQPPPIASDLRAQQMFALLPSLSLLACLQLERAF